MLLFLRAHLTLQISLGAVISMLHMSTIRLVLLFKSTANYSFSIKHLPSLVWEWNASESHIYRRIDQTRGRGRGDASERMDRRTGAQHQRRG